MYKKQKDRHLDVPAEANRDKHINFIAEERGEIDPGEEPSTGPLNTSDSSQEEVNKKKKNDNPEKKKNDNPGKKPD